MEYPTYYRKAAVCICRKTETTGIRVEIPAIEGDLLPTIHSPVVTADSARFDAMVNTWEVVTEDIYFDYLGTLFSITRKKSEILNEHRQSLYDAGKLKL